MLMFYLSVIEEEEDREKFTVLYFQWRELMLRKAYGILQDRDLSEDAVQEALLFVAQNIQNIGDPRSAATKAYLMLVTDSSAKKLRNRRRDIVNEDLFESLDVDNTTAEEAFFDAYDLEQLVDKIKSLPEAYSKPLLLKYAMGHKTDEIARMMGIKPDLVRKRIERAKKKLRQLLNEEKLTQ